MSSTGRRMRRGAAVAAAALAVAGASGCGSADGGSGGGGGAGKRVRIAFFGLAAENAYTQFAYKGAQAEAKAKGAELSFFDGKFDGPTQIKQIQDAITSQRFDAFVVMPNDQPGVVPVAKQAIGQGISVTALQFPIGSDPKTARPQVEGLTASVVEDVVAGARISAEGINAMCRDRDPCKVALLYGSRKVTWDGAAKRPTILRTLTPNVKVVAEADGQFLQGPSEQAAADILQAHPDLDVLASPSGDQMALGGERALRAAGKRIGLGDRPRGAVAIIGYGAASSGVERVRRGSWYQTYALVPQTMARKAVDLAVAAVRGGGRKGVGIVQTEISPIGDNVTREVLREHPSFRAEWEG
ncbi:sugar ABC transporter substrate-binding protein [Patulibacter defluvii]|uniref:sugar ABC transporter substrate-binding protein n=1 Tax=Patulibacter defluvii TaxID=3095358 RepID=UPI002A7475EE|nr:sugar ABC transporter substrate-binding protein [Patulibacter sp. DM4]